MLFGRVERAVGPRSRQAGCSAWEKWGGGCGVQRHGAIGIDHRDLKVDAGMVVMRQRWLTVGVGLIEQIRRNRRTMIGVVIVMIIGCGWLMVVGELGGVGIRDARVLGSVLDAMLRITRGKGLGRDHQEHNQTNAELTQECEHEIPQTVVSMRRADL